MEIQGSDHVLHDIMCLVYENGMHWLRIGIIQRIQQVKNLLQVWIAFQMELLRLISSYLSLVTVFTRLRPSVIRGPALTIGRLLLIRRVLLTHVSCTWIRLMWPRIATSTVPAVTPFVVSRILQMLLKLWLLLLMKMDENYYEQNQIELSIN